MKVLVFDVAADRGGALTILNAAHEAALRHREHEWVFVVSTPRLDESDSVRLRRFPWTKRSWLHRAWFDLVVAPQMVREERPDAILSLQNLSVRRTSLPQIIYLHTAVPFSSYRFKLQNNPRLWLYQRVITRLILMSIKTARTLVVQANWMKSSLVECAGIEQERVKVIPPTPKERASQDQRYWPTGENRRRFFYPASAVPYKNHATLFAAAERLEGRGVTVDIICTISHRELRQLAIQEVPSNVRLVGRMPYEEVQRTYERSALVFPSILETVGLPLMEAQARGTFVLAPSLPYARDALANYPNAYFFDPEDPNELVSLMAAVAQGLLHYTSDPAPALPGKHDPWDELVEVVTAL